MRARLTLYSCILNAGIALLLSQPCFAVEQPCGNVGGIPQSCDPEVNARYLRATGDTWPLASISGGERTLRMAPNNMGSFFGPNWQLDMPGRLWVDVSFTVTLDITTSQGYVGPNSKCGIANDNTDLITSLGMGDLTVEQHKSDVYVGTWGSRAWDDFYNADPNWPVAKFQITAHAGQTVLKEVAAKRGNFTFQELVSSKTGKSYTTNRYTATITEPLPVPVVASLSDVEFRLTPTDSDVIQQLVFPRPAEGPPGWLFNCRIYNFSARLNNMDAGYYITN